MQPQSPWKGTHGLIQTKAAPALVTSIHGYLCPLGCSPSRILTAWKKHFQHLAGSTRVPRKEGKRHGMKTWSHWKPLPCCSTGSDFSPCPSFGDFCRITGTHREYLAQLHRGRARKFLSSVSADFLLLRICQPNSFILMSTTAVSPQLPIKERISRILPEELRAPLFFLPQWRVIFSCRGSCWMERLVGASRWKHWWD